jgi:O-antigen/teichoic acid export membrane protein
VTDEIAPERRRRATDAVRERREAEPADTIEESSEAVFEAVVPLPPAERRARGLIRSGAIVAVAVAVSNLLNVVFQLATARLLPPAEYSLIVTLFAIVMIANVPILSLQAKVAREVAQALAHAGPREAGGVMIESLRPLARWGAIVVGGGILVAIPFVAVFNVERVLPGLAVAAAVLATVPIPIATGGLQGSERFAMLGLVQVVYGALKVGFGVGLAALGFGAAAILFGITAGTLVALALAFIPMRQFLRAGRPYARRRRRLFDSYTRGAAIVLMLIAAITNMDLIAARVFLDNDAAGHFAAVGVAARGMLLLPLVATTVLFPRVAVLRDLAAERNHLLGGLAAVAALGIVPLAIFFAIPETVIEIAFGSEYVDGQDWLGPLAAAMLVMALVEVYMFHFLALGRVRYAAVLAAGQVLQLVLFAAMHDTAEQLIAVQGITAVFLLVLSEAFDRRDRWLGRSRKPADPEEVQGA